MATERTRTLPIDFRQQDVGRIMDRWHAAESCSLVGVGSVGKSNLLQHLANHQVQAAYMKEAKVKLFKAILIDPSLMAPLPQRGSPDSEQMRCWAGYELLMHRLFMAFHGTGALDPEETRRFYETYQQLQNGTNPLFAYMGLRYFEHGLEFFLRRGFHLVFMFDEFEELLHDLPVKFFLTLRGLRDANKKQLSYLTFTRMPLPAILAREEIDPLAIEQFVELFTDNTYFIGPYSDMDARRMVDDLMARNQVEYDEYTINFLLWATGCFAGLLRAGFRSLETLPDLSPSAVMTRSDRLASQLAVKLPIQAECRTIWMSLSDVEKQVLKAAGGLINFNRDAHSAAAVQLLAQKSLLKVADDNSLHIEPPVFQHFVSQNPA